MHFNEGNKLRIFFEGGGIIVVPLLWIDATVVCMTFPIENAYNCAVSGR